MGNKESKNNVHNTSKFIYSEVESKCNEISMRNTTDSDILPWIKVNKLPPFQTLKFLKPLSVYYSKTDGNSYLIETMKKAQYISKYNLQTGDLILISLPNIFH
eukprot:247843_1